MTSRRSTGPRQATRGCWALLAPLAVALVLVPFASARASVSCSVCGPNLVQNPGAEDGTGSQHDTIVPIPSWTVTAGGFTVVTYSWSGGSLTSTSPGPSDRGKNYFYGGPGGHGNVAQATQTISLDNDPAVAAGLVHAKLSGWLGGAINHEDHAYVSASFVGSSGHVISYLSLGPFPPSARDGNDGLYYHSASGLVPHGATSIVVLIKMHRYLFGAPPTVDDNGMADDVSVVLSCGSCSSS